MRARNRPFFYFSFSLSLSLLPLPLLPVRLKVTNRWKSPVEPRPNALLLFQSRLPFFHRSPLALSFTLFLYFRFLSFGEVCLMTDWFLFSISRAPPPCRVLLPTGNLRHLRRIAWTRWSSALLDLVGDLRRAVRIELVSWKAPVAFSLLYLFVCVVLHGTYGNVLQPRSGAASLFPSVYGIVAGAIGDCRYSHFGCMRCVCVTRA